MEHLDEARAVLREHGFLDYPTPWIDRAARETQRNGPYSDYAGWESWMSEQMDSPCIAIGEKNKEGCRCYACCAFGWWETADGLARTQLWLIMTRACEMTAEAMGWKPEPNARLEA